MPRLEIPRAVSSAWGLGWKRLVVVASAAGLTLGVSLGGSRLLSYHEALVAQGAGEMIARGDWLVPTICGVPWLEKPPLAHWLVALGGWWAGGLDETVARLPSALAAGLMVLLMACWAASRFGGAIGMLTGLIQATTYWTVLRGRLADADILLAALIVAALILWDVASRQGEGEGAGEGAGEGENAVRAGAPSRSREPWLWGFFLVLGLTSWAKGIGFGAVLVLAVVLAVAVWDRDAGAMRCLLKDWRRAVWKWGLAAVLALTWPVLISACYPSVLSLWATHLLDRLSAQPRHFTGDSAWSCVVEMLAQGMPWTPLVLFGAWGSLLRAVGWRPALNGVCRGGTDRLLWAWAVVPVVLILSATVKNAHYLIHAQPPWSVWAALGGLELARWAESRGWSPDLLRWCGVGVFGALIAAFALGFAVVAPRFDGRGMEWAFYRQVGEVLGKGVPISFVYDDWDRKPYETPFGPVPHDLAVRLFYLGRTATWYAKPRALVDQAGSRPMAVVGRDRDRPHLERLGRVTRVLQGPSRRSDRTYVLFLIDPLPESESVQSLADRSVVVEGAIGGPR